VAVSCTNAHSNATHYALPFAMNVNLCLNDLHLVPFLLLFCDRWRTPPSINSCFHGKHAAYAQAMYVGTQ
jgi:hypothetical protein